MTLAFTITTHGHLAGVRLSLAGHWTNKPHPDDEAAADAARAVAAGRPFTIERKSYPAMTTFRGAAHHEQFASRPL